ncbi:hypothetical protein CBQ28_02285 [Pseudoalteromonas sp. GCY]|uniref:hypothetical protein n=1 Tax=Pseudoalteromonas TaxID=53246 RepID=UPI000BFF0DC4|nr:hypothetical protein [Pseudoalteromonas sp. GCY]PHI38859.1 hypothetical protein CBQ28_02285 [Pseudoalteromonas sp. GCY]QQQ65953.1 hypothetical protein JJQ94_16775 [Pseudoalteromonas sp. GCY]
MDWFAFFTFATVVVSFGVAISFYFKVSKRSYSKKRPNEARFLRLGYQYKDAMSELDIDVKLKKLKEFEEGLILAIEEHEETINVDVNGNVSFLDVRKAALKKAS